MYNRKGPFKNTYQLKPEYKTAHHLTNTNEGSIAPSSGAADDDGSDAAFVDDMEEVIPGSSHSLSDLSDDEEHPL